MISETPIRLIRIRPHHIGTFAEYWINGKLIDGTEDAIRHNQRFVSDLRGLYGRIAQDTEDIGILIVDGAEGDSICDLCDTPHTCGTRQKPDDLNIWNGSGLIMQYSGLEFGKIYSSPYFRERVKKLYPHKKPQE